MESNIPVALKDNVTMHWFGELKEGDTKKIFIIRSDVWMYLLPIRKLNLKIIFLNYLINCVPLKI